MGSMAYWDEKACRYDAIMDDVIGRKLRGTVFRRISSFADTGQTLEIGCGTGFFTRAALPDSSSLIATDISMDMLSVAHNSIPGVEFLRADCMRLPFMDASFDTVLMANVIKFIDDPALALRECRRVLKPGGRLILMFYTEHYMGIMERAAFFKRLLKSLGKPPVFHLRSPDEVADMALKEGFIIDGMELIGDRLKAAIIVCHTKAF